ncbi:acyl-CoA thioesterase [Suttonella sp. R2A3]|uniref:acyl-CoA thioesterase n=1 Tax=Suttonella sp. R2A3 TaxID=2908648 RepID=UPI001F3E9D2E|nr:thioesterase family protein [Suttonella sp. R2A3]UJF24993.1 acyl-CoA thioesterase [Suttonella sp. R2A3]
MSHFSTTLTVRVGDINFGGHVGHDRLIALLHHARHAFLRSFGYSELDCGGVALIMRRIEVDYLAELFLDDAIEIAVWADDFRNKRFCLHYRVSKGEKVAAKAQTVMVSFDYQARQVAALPEIVVERLGSSNEC